MAKLLQLVDDILDLHIELSTNAVQNHNSPIYYFKSAEINEQNRIKFNNVNAKVFAQIFSISNDVALYRTELIDIIIRTFQKINLYYLDTQEHTNAIYQLHMLSILLIRHISMDMFESYQTNTNTNTNTDTDYVRIPSEIIAEELEKRIRKYDSPILLLELENAIANIERSYSPGGFGAQIILRKQSEYADS